MSKPRGICVYCGQLGVTKEHFWGAWSRRHAPANNTHSTHKLERFINFDPAGEKLALKGHLDRPGAARSQTLKIACRECNNGWMKTNVDAAIPILKRMHYGYWGKISDIDAQILTHWIAQFSMSYEFADRETAMIPQSVRTEFAKNNELVGSWIVAIGVAAPLTGSEPIYHRAMFLKTEDGSVEPAQVTVFMFGMLLAVSYYSSYPVEEPILTVLSGMRLAVINPFPKCGITRPLFRHSEATVPNVVEAVSEAFLRSDGCSVGI